MPGHRSLDDLAALQSGGKACIHDQRRIENPAEANEPGGVEEKKAA